MDVTKAFVGTTFILAALNQLGWLPLPALLLVIMYLISGVLLLVEAFVRPVIIRRRVVERAE